MSNTSIPEWYLIQAHDYIAVLHNIEMYTHEELLNITIKQRKYEYELLRVKNGLRMSEGERPKKEVKKVEVVMPPPRPQLSISYSQLMSMGYGSVHHSNRSQKKVNSYA